MLRFIRTLTMVIVGLLLSACQPLIVPVPVVMPAQTPAQVAAVLPVDAVTLPTNTPLLTMTIEVNELRDVGSSQLGSRYVSYFTGGAVSGSIVAGEVLANGENWYLIRLDSVAELVIQGAFKTAAGEQITFKTLAFARMDPALMERVLAGAVIDPTTKLFRGVTFFTTEATQYAWLNDCVTLVTLTYDLQQVQITVYANSADSD
ncbi:MAG: DUF3237 domain-containing protein [Caldilineaceae bacterium]